MKKHYALLLGVFLLFQLSLTAQVVCDLNYLTTIENFVVYEHVPSGAILYRAKFAVDADGCPRAYGPNNSGLDWTANAGYPGNWWGVVTDSNGDPVIQGSGDPYPGMYVSTTSLVRSGYSNTNPLRYVDSENIPYIALPSALQSLAGIQKGDLVYVKNTVTGLDCYAYFADTGPGGKLGEGSMYLADQIGLNSSPKTGGTSSGIIDYIVFPQSGMGQGTHLTVAQINSMGEAELTVAGGPGLADCIDNYNPLDCSNTIPLTCGVTYSGAASTAPSKVGTYGCNSWTESGPERIHSIIPSGNGTITATLTNFTGDLDVYILGSCDPDDCLGTVGSSSATYANAVAGQTYYIVVDADDGSGSAYDLVVDCPTSSSTDNFSLSNTSISGNPIVAGDNVTVQVSQNYSGSQTSSVLADPTVSYYLSTDCNLSSEDILLGSDQSNIGSDNTTSVESSIVTIPNATSAGSYYILFVADANNDISESDENDNITCVSITIDPLVLDCSSAVALTCGVVYHGTSSTATSNVETYGCNSWTESGPERIHTIVPSNDGTLAASISNFTGDLDVYLLGSCDPSDCLGTVSSSSVTYANAIAGHTYYIVVDADDGSGSAYDLIVSCPTVPDDLYSSSETIAVTHADTSEVVNVSLTLNYVGSQLALNIPDVDVSYYLSTDCILDGGDILCGNNLTNIGSDLTPVNVMGTATIPNTVISGNYYLIYSIDDNDVLTESDENNNTACMPITVCTNTTGVDTKTACLSYTWIDGNTYTSNNNTATHTIIGGTRFGCDSTVTLDLTINSVDTSVTQSGNILTANASNASYQWLDCVNNYNIINGETTSSYEPLVNGSYAVEVYQNGCADTSYCYEVMYGGLDMVSINNEIKIYPNPADQKIIQFNKVVSVSIYDQLGKLCIKEKNVSWLNIEELTSGVYLVITAEGEKVKLVVQ